MRVGVLGPLAVWSDGEPVAVPEAKVRELLAVLAVHGGHPVSADRLVDALWGSDLPANPLGALQTKISRLRRALGRDLVPSGPAGYRLAVPTDAADFEARLGERPGAEQLRAALALWRGEAYAEFADQDFARAERHRLTELRLRVVEDLGESLLAQGHPADALAETAEAAAAHPLRERLQAVRLRALYLTGRQAEALSAYDTLRRRLGEELGVDPGPELATLYDQVLRHDPDLRAAPRTNLPAALVDLVGREEQLVRVRRLLAHHRLVTLTGPGGVGKTSLATAVADGLEFPDGVWLVDLTTATDVEEAVAAQLCVRGGLTTAVRDLRTLLVLDNCEHLVEQTAHVVADLLRSAPGLRVLATSREVLGVPGERLEPVLPLSAPDAVRLFRSRAEAAGAPVADLADTDLAVLCTRLDGLPLALELAASRLPVLGLPELTARLADRFRLLTSGGRLSPPRQRTLRAVIDWSWELLTDPERQVLRRLSVFADGASLPAVEAVCPDPVDTVARLADKSLLWTEPGPRYRLLESVSAYAAEHLTASGEAEEVRARHRLAHLALASGAELRGAAAATWLPRLDVEAANLRRALDNAVAAHDLDTALALVHHQAWHWYLRGRWAEGARQCRQALSVPGEHPVRPSVRGWYRGFELLRLGGTHAEARRAVIDSPPAGPHVDWFLAHVLHHTGGDLAASTARLPGATGDQWVDAAVRSTQAAHALLRGDLASAEGQAQQSLTVFSSLGDAWGVSQATYARAAVAEITGDYELAAELHTSALEGVRSLLLWPQVADHLTGLARVDLLTGNHSRAAERHEQARHLAAGHGYQAGAVHAELGLALGARRTGDLDTAERLLHRVLVWHEHTNFAPGTALPLAELGFAAEQRGDAASALSWHTRGLSAAESGGDPRAIALALEGLAGARALLGEDTRDLLAQAASLRATAGAPLPPAERGDVARIEALLQRQHQAGVVRD